MSPSYQSLSKSYVHGRFLSGQYLEQWENYFPATGEVIGHLEVADETIIQQAVHSAQDGLQSWAKFSAKQRAEVLLQASQILKKRNEELAYLEVLDTGKPIAEALTGDILAGAECLEYFAHLAVGLQGDYIDLGQSFGYTRREPLGVCAGIGAWNYPLLIACWKAAPALACGNSLIFKPSELTPLTSLKLAEIFTEAGLPPGVFNVVLGGKNTGELLATHPSIAKISVTGSVATGKQVMKSASQTLKHVTMELGGKSPLIIFEDAHWQNALSAALMANYYTQGEICSNGTRVFVHDSIYDRFLHDLIQRIEKLKIGDPRDPKTDIGSLIGPQHLEKVLHFCSIGRKEGAQLAYGGTRPFANDLQNPLHRGSFMTPTLFSECTDDMTIIKEEIFGPVMSLLRFTHEDEVIQRANNTTYGLAAGVFTMNLPRAHRIVSQLQAGVCWVNNYNITPVELPFGGYKSSGIGRENGKATLEHYTQLKTVYVEMGDVACPYE